jgi:hypothetical protein
MTEKLELEDKIDLMTTWIESEDVQGHDRAGWITNCWTFAMEEYEDTGVKSTVSTTISQISKAAKRYQIEGYPIASRTSSNMTQEMTDLIASHGNFLDNMVQAFESLPENHVIHSKKSEARPDRRYADAKDWRNHWLKIITDKVKEEAKEATQ